MSDGPYNETYAQALKAAAQGLPPGDRWVANRMPGMTMRAALDEMANYPKLQSLNNEWPDVRELLDKMGTVRENIPAALQMYREYMQGAGDKADVSGVLGGKSDISVPYLPERDDWYPLMLLAKHGASNTRLQNVFNKEPAAWDTGATETRGSTHWMDDDAPVIASTEGAWPNWKHELGHLAFDRLRAQGGENQDRARSFTPMWGNADVADVGLDRMFHQTTPPKGQKDQWPNLAAGYKPEDIPEERWLRYMVPGTGSMATKAYIPQAEGQDAQGIFNLIDAMTHPELWNRRPEE